jgi:2,4-dienoyl-CoA reductase (NADPH2)
MVTVAKDLINNLKSLGVDILLGIQANRELITKMAPDAVVVATGAKPILPDITGIEGRNVVQAWDLLDGKVGVGQRVAIVGGNGVGLETAIYLANLGTISPEVLHFLMANRAETTKTLTELLNKGNKEVTVVEMTKTAGKDIGLSTRWTVVAELRRLGVKIMTRTRATGVTTDGLEVEREGSRDLLVADSVVIAGGSRSENELADQIQEMVSEIYIVGDAEKPRNALEAIREGFMAGLRL